MCSRDAEKAGVDRQKIAAEIAREEHRLSELRSEIEERTARLTSLRTILSASSLQQRAPHMPTVHGPVSNAEKVVLFRSLFRGREDVFPRRWENPKTGRSGYSPVCANEWAHGVCAKSKARGQQRRAACGDCPNRAFVPVTDDVIAHHLKGTHVIGVYPLLPDETCWFLAADFDRKSWSEDIAAFVETCKASEVPVAVERSRSGNGAHAWIFFTVPIPAIVARKMGCLLITETMGRRHQLSMKSYDRLFPNQDTVPKGGFGNLIALPLQRAARDHGNSVFIDDDFTAHPDQWGYSPQMQMRLSTGILLMFPVKTPDTSLTPVTPANRDIWRQVETPCVAS